MAAAQDDLSDALVDALNAAYGVHPGHRAAHAKGVLCAATFTASPAAGAISRAPHFQGDPVRAHVRFSNGAGKLSTGDVREQYLDRIDGHRFGASSQLEPARQQAAGKIRQSARLYLSSGDVPTNDFAAWRFHQLPGKCRCKWE